jgi:RecJ-like exonuclease
MGETQRVMNVRVCRRVNGEDDILVCERCGNEVEADGNVCWSGSEQVIRLFEPRGNFCQWCGAPLKEAD